MKYIPLTQGKFAIVDDEDYEELSKYKWHLSKLSIFYARKTRKYESGKFSTISMHRYLLNAQKGMFVDHINGNGLDNRRSNIRICTQKENNRNMRIGKKNKSGYKGVSWATDAQKWRAFIYVEGKNINLGRFSDKEAAAGAYNEAAKKYHGEFASLNIL